MKIYIDESGNTGADYMNQDQPNFVIGVHWINSSDWVKEKEKIFKNLKADELKFKHIMRKKDYAAMGNIIKFLGAQTNNFCSYVVQKKSILIEKFVHDCIEPVCWADGIDISERGGILAYTNLLNAVLPAEMGREWYHEFLKRYNMLIRNKESAQLSDLVSCCFTAKEMSKELLCPFLYAPEKALIEVRSDNYRADSYHALMIGLVAHLRNYFHIKEFELICDQTSIITKDKLKSFVGFLECFPEEVTVSSICKISPDITIKGIEYVDSKEDDLIQLADIIAGITNYSLLPKNMKSDVSKFFCEMLEDRNLIHKICTRDVTPTALGTEETPALISQFLEMNK